MRRRFTWVVAALCLTTCSGHSSTTAPRHAPAPLSIATDPKTLSAVAIASCTANPRGNVQISGTVHNTTSGTANYVVELSIRSHAGKALYATAAAAPSVAPKAFSHWTAVTTARFQPGMRCAVTGVSQR